MKSIIITVLLLSVASPIAFAQNEPIRLALTVDDLPKHGDVAEDSDRLEIANELIDTFEYHRIPQVIGFVNSKRVDNTASLIEVLKTWVSRGLLLGNHTYSHIDLTRSSANAFIKEIERGEALVSKLSGDKHNKYFRYPFLHEGDTLEKRNAVKQYLRENGYHYAPVTIDYKDYLFNTPLVRCLTAKDSDSIAKLRAFHIETMKRLFKNQIDGARRVFGHDIAHVLVIHLGISQALWFADIAQVLEQMGIKWISLDEAIVDDAYKLDPGKAFASSGLFTNQIAKVKNIKFNAYPDELELKKKLKSFCL